MRYLFTVLGLLLAASVFGCQEEKSLTDRTIIDLSYPYNEQTIYWPTAQPFELETVSEGITEQGYFYSANRFSMAEHGGTHIDAPYHFWKEGNTVEAIPVERFIGKGVVIDVSDSALANPDYQVSIDDFKSWEQQYGRIPVNAIVLMRTGYGRYWPDPEKYLGTAERGQEAIETLHFPGLHPEAADWISAERSINIIGLDTPSIDYGQSTGFQSHVILFKQNIPVIENAANLDKLPTTGFQIIALPMKIEGGSGGPVRMIAILESSKAAAL